MTNFLFCIDVGFTHTGMSIFKIEKGLTFINCLTVVTEKSDKKKQVRVADDDSERIKIIIRGVNDFVSDYEYGKIMVAVELPTGGAQGARPNRTMGLITGAIVTYVEMKGWPTEYVTPTDVKIAVTGNKTASKNEIMERIRNKLKRHSDKLPKTKDKFEHIADSVGIALFIKRNSEMFKVFSK